MPIRQSIDSARKERIGTHGVDGAALNDALAKTAPALDWIRARHADGALPLLRLPERRDDIHAIRTAGAQLASNASDIVILGTGGSSLGGQTLAQLADYARRRRGSISQRPAPAFHGQPRSGHLRRPAQAAAARDLALCCDLEVGQHRRDPDAGHRRARGGEGRRARGTHPRSVRRPHRTGEGRQALGARVQPGLRVLCDEYKIAMLEHDPGVGGRFSVLTNVGLLPAAALGLDIDAIRDGAAAALKPILDKRAPGDVPAAVGAALSVAIGKPIAVMMAYADRLERFTRWYVQLWAESLGKDGKGTTPIAARGPVDQHSQLQLFIAGPRDKLFTVITTGTAGRGPRIEAELAKLAGEPDFAGKTMGDLVAAQGRATAETLAKNGCPVRTMHVDKLDETSLGELLMHFMLETIIAAHLLGVDPFDQPAVEEGKILAKQYLKG